MSGSLGNLSLKSPFIVHKSHRNSKNYIFFHGSRNFRKLELCLVNNSDKVNFFAKITFMFPRPEMAMSQSTRVCAGKKIK